MAEVALLRNICWQKEIENEREMKGK